MSIQYHTLGVYQLLLELWLTYEEIKNITELIRIDLQQSYILQRRDLHRRVDEIAIHIRNKWPSTLPPFFLFNYVIKI